VDDPRIERTVDHVKIVSCPACGKDVEFPREEPWIIAGDQQHSPMLVAFICPHCEHEIRLDASSGTLGLFGAE
jgi:hypothetical protein